MDGQDGQDGVSPTVTAFASGSNVIITVTDGSGSHEYVIPTTSGEVTQLPANWTETNTSSPQYIMNKPTNVSAFTNDAGYLTADSLANLSGQLNALQQTIDSIQQTVSAYCPTTVRDYDGNVYNTVQIGEQCWMRENLRTTHYSDGTAIEAGTSTSTTIPYRYAPANNENNVPTYGYLYNWPAVMNGAASSNANPSGVQGICPEGWHVPSDAEWSQLTDYVSGQDNYVCGDNSGNIAKALAATTGWTSYGDECNPGDQSVHANNATGFSALPASNFDGYNNFLGIDAFFWCSTQYDVGGAYDRGLNYGYAGVLRYIYIKYNGFSVRCVCDNNSSVGDCLQGVSEQIAAQQSEVEAMQNTLDSLAPVAFSGDYNDLVNTPEIPAEQVNADWNATSGKAQILNKPTIPTVPTNVSAFTNDAGYLTSANVQEAANIPTNVSAFTNDAGYITADSLANLSGQLNALQQAFDSLQQNVPVYCPPTVRDYDGNVYNTVQIGEQCWMRENLRTTHYLDGTAIEAGTSTSTTIPYRYAPDNNENNVATYGYLYNWPAVMHGSASSNANPSGVQGICPDGWHVPSDAEWNQLTDFVSSHNNYVCGDNSDNIAKALAATTSWSSSSNSCAVGNDLSTNNATGFSALPVGYYYGNYDIFGYFANFWSATEYDDDFAYSRYLYHNAAGVNWANPIKYLGFLVRCVRNNNRSVGDYLQGVGEQIAAQQSEVETLQNMLDSLAPVAFSGDYNDLSNTPSIPAEQVNADWNATSGKAQILNKPNLATVATSGNYNDLSNTPIIPAAQVNTDWNATSGPAEILNKPTIPTVPTNVSAFTNDAGYLTAANVQEAANIPTNVSAFTNDAGYLTADSLANLSNQLDALQQAFDSLQQTVPVYCPTTVRDYDGNVYNTVQIGEQCWMRENLRTTHYSDGTVIEAGTSTNNTIPYRYVPDNNENNVATHGYLYNWPAVMYGSTSSYAKPSGVQGICPDGWHVPSNAEWSQLTDYVSGQNNYVCGDNSNNIAKALAAPTGWNSDSGECNPGDQSVYANNATGFSALPAGSYYGNYTIFGEYAYFWSATESNSNVAYFCYLGFCNAYVNWVYDAPKSVGFSVRCVHDNNYSLGDYLQGVGEQIAAQQSGVETIQNALDSLASVAFSGDYNDLSNTPAIPAEQVNADWNATFGKAQILNKPNLASVATTGNYNDLSNTPAIPAEQVNADWNANSGKAQIFNKPSLAPVATTGNYNDLSNRPTIPTVPTNVSAFTNDAGYLTAANVQQAANIPTNVSAFQNDAGYLTAADVPAMPQGSHVGDLLYWNGSAWVLLPAGQQGQQLVMNNNIPAWQNVATGGGPYYILFNANGGSGSMNAQFFPQGVAQTINGNTFVRNGYMFTGWNTAADGSGTSYGVDAVITLTSNITLYAQWTTRVRVPLNNPCRENDNSRDIRGE